MRRSLLILSLLALPAAGFSQPAGIPEDPATVAAPPPSAAPTVIDLLARGKARMKHGDLASAREIFADAAARFPEDVRPHLNLAQICLDGDPPDLDGAEREARIAYGIDPSRPLGLVWLAAGLRDAGELVRAEAIAQEGLSTFPEHPRLLHVLGTIRIAQGDPDSGRRILQKAAAAEPEDVVIRRALSLAQAHENLEGQALMGLTSVRDAFPADVEVRRTLAGLYRFVGDEEHARIEDEMAELLEFTEASAAVRRRTLQAVSERIRRLEESAARPDAPTGELEELWRLYEWRGDMEWNLGRMEQVAAARPDSPEAQAARGMVLLVRGSAEAEALFLAVLEDSPAEPLALEGLRRLYESQEKPEPLRELAGRAVESEPEEAAAHRFHARVLHSAGEDEAARAAYRRALELDADDVESLLELADLEREAGELESAARRVEHAASLETDTPRIEMARGQLARARGDAAAAETHLQRAQDLGGRGAALFRLLGDLATERGDTRMSLYYYRLSLGVEPDQPELIESLTSGG